MIVCSIIQNPNYICNHEPGNQRIYSIPTKRHTFQESTSSLPFQKGNSVFLANSFPPGLDTTFNSIQGNTLYQCGTDLRDDTFVRGQLYFGFSRVLSKKDILVLVEEEQTKAA